MKIISTIPNAVPRLFKLDLTKEYVIEVNEKRSRRSIEQNKLLWKLVHAIAKHSAQDDYEVYCSALERADAASDYIITATEMAEQLRKSFRGVRFVRMQEVNGKDCYVYKVYIGSSKMNTKEMTELIDCCLQICAEYGIAEALYE